MKYVLVSGGVISGVGKGIIASSTGLLLKTLGLKVTAIKIDPYVNVDAGTMNPKEHGEVYVLDDGGEVDLDLGNYERYLNVTLTRENNITTGKIYQHVIERERRGDYLGATVQVVPHITDAIQEWIERVAQIPVDDTNETPDICIVELGGTIGDIESMAFVQALTQLQSAAGKNNFVHIHVSYVPTIHGEQKTKPTQKAAKEVRSAGLIPDLIACRCEKDLEHATIAKVAKFCQVDTKHVLVVRDMPSTYLVPGLLQQQGLIPILEETLALGKCTISESTLKKGRELWQHWIKLTSQTTETLEVVTIALVGKYTTFHDSYISVVKSLEHSAMRCHRKLNLKWIDSENLEPAAKQKDLAGYHKAWHDLATAQGILVPGGFGTRGTEGMIAAAHHARTNNKPYLGICLGMQIAVIEFARNVCGIKEATSEEFAKEKETPKATSSLNIAAQNEQSAGTVAPALTPKKDNNLIVFMPEIDRNRLGGTMRLGNRATHFQEKHPWSKLRPLYNNKPEVNERHRHRYEVNPAWVDDLEAAGLSFVGKDDEGVRMEIVEIKSNNWFVAVQYHPEYLSRVLKPSRPYLGLVAASSGILDEVTLEESMRNATLNSERENF
jgi:CTP synthase